MSSIMAHAAEQSLVADKSKTWMNTMPVIMEQPQEIYNPPPQQRHIEKVAPPPPPAPVDDEDVQLTEEEFQSMYEWLL